MSTYSPEDFACNIDQLPLIFFSLIVRIAVLKDISEVRRT